MAYKFIIMMRCDDCYKEIYINCFMFVFLSQYKMDTPLTTPVNGYKSMISTYSGNGQIQEKQSKTQTKIVCCLQCRCECHQRNVNHDYTTTSGLNCKSRCNIIKKILGFELAR